MLVTDAGRDVAQGRVQNIVSQSAASRAARTAPARRMVTPFARALDLLCAFTTQDGWLGNRELMVRTGLPASTVTRIARSLVELGYLHFDDDTRRYRLAASVLALGYAAIANSGIQRSSRAKMREFAQQHRLHVSLGSRCRLEVVVVESCSSAQAPMARELHVGSRVGIASAPMGWALLAAVPEFERYYLMECIERRMPREWPRLRRRMSEAIAQLSEQGYCRSPAVWGTEVTTISAPIAQTGRAPMVVSCTGPNSQLSRARIVRELGPKLLAMAAGIESAGAVA